jgi:hypothetical protein
MVQVLITELYENLNALVPMDLSSLNFHNGFKYYKGIHIVKDLFLIDYVLLK